MGRQSKTELTHTEVINNLIRMRINEGKSKIDMNQYLLDLTYAPSTARDLIYESMHKADDMAMVFFKADLIEDISRWEAMFEEAKSANNGKQAAVCLEQICKLKGHYIEKKEITGDITFTAKFGDE